MESGESRWSCLQRQRRLTRGKVIIYSLEGCGSVFSSTQRATWVSVKLCQAVSSEVIDVSDAKAHLSLVAETSSSNTLHSECISDSLGMLYDHWELNKKQDQFQGTFLCICFFSLSQAPLMSTVTWTAWWKIYHKSKLIKNFPTIFIWKTDLLKISSSGR